MTVGDRIKNKRLELELSQTELAKKAGYSDKTAISKIENAGNDITMKQVRRIAAALGTTDVYLMGWDSADVLQDADVPMSAKVKTETNTQKAVDIYNQIMELPQRDQEELFSYLQYLRTKSDSPRSNS